MIDLTTEQLEAIRRLLVDPLRDAVRQEIKLGHQRLSSAVELLDQRLGTCVKQHERRLIAVERSTGQLRAFRRKLVAIYGVVTVIAGVAWSILREKVLSRLHDR